MSSQKNIAVILGDGIGPEVTIQAIRVLDAVANQFGHNFNYTYALMGAIAIDQTGDPLPQETLEICKKSDAILFGAIGHPKFDQDPAAFVRPEQGLLRLRKELELYTNIRPIVAYPSLHHLSPIKSSILEEVDLIIYREINGGIYFGKKETNESGTEATDLCIYKKSEIVRIADLAFKHAQKRKKKLTLVDKANVLETSRLWRKTILEISKKYPDVTTEYMYVDNAAMQLIINPRQFDIILTENMFGDILSDVACVLAGSVGMLPSASTGDGPALFEPIHGSYPQAAGKDIANPIGSILSAAMMLAHFGMKKEASKIRMAVEWTLQNKFVTKDIDPLNFYFTSTIGEMVCDYILNRSNDATHSENIEIRKSTII